MVYGTTKETWHTLWVFSINSNFEMFYCEDIVSTGFHNGIHTFLIMTGYNHKLALACGLVKIPSSRRTFDRRLKTISIDIKKRILTMGYLFVATEGLADVSITAVDRVLS
jgi:hypothetical protein